MKYLNISDIGKVNVVSDTDLLGQRGYFLDFDRTATAGGVKTNLSGMVGEAILVYNNNGGTLAAGTVMQWDTGATYGPGRGVETAGSTTTVPAGVVNPYISAAVPIAGIFWLILTGPCKFLFSTGTTLAPADLLACGASGRVIKATVGTTNDHYTVGTTIDAVDTAIATDTLFRGYAHFKFGG